MTCVDCHGAHAYRYNWQNGLNANLIGRDSNDWPISSWPGTYNTIINTPNSGLRNVVFESRGTDATPPGTFYNSFADNDDDGDGVYDGICEVCHTSTSYHRNTSAGDHTHNTGKQCTVCHAHDNKFKGEGACTSCHNTQQGTAPHIMRQVTEAGGDFVDNASRHVFGGTVDNWDCIVCHAEGDTTSYDTTVSTTTEHNDLNPGNPDYYKTIAMRNVDSTQNPGIANVDFWRWPKTCCGNTPSDADLTRMDTFCMHCHDSDASRGGSGGGASGVAVLDSGLGVSNATQSPTLAERLRPFNPTDALDDGTIQTGSAEPGATLTTWFANQSACEAKGFTWTGSACTDKRSRVVDVYGQFNTGNPSHHAVLGQRYTTKNGTDAFCDGSLDRNFEPQADCENAGYVWDTTLYGGPYCIIDPADAPDQATCESLGTGRDTRWIVVGWGETAWANYTLKNGTSLKAERETVTLHCADCHTVDTNAHGGGNSYMMTTSAIDTTCFTCHNQTTYNGSSNNGESRFNHTTDANVWSGKASGGSRLDPNSSSGTKTVGMCVLCHGGAHYDGYGAIHGIPSSSTDLRRSQPRYRFIGGSTMSYGYAGSDWSTAGTAGTCYFISPDPQPWSYCSHHAAGTVSGSSSQYPKPVSY